MANFNAYGKYYDLLYRDKDYKAEAEYIVKLINRYKPDASSILELGSGSGAHAEFICQQGYTVTGIERSEKMVDEARRKNIIGFTPIVADITDFTLEESVDATISLFHVVSYLTENVNLIRAFKLTALHLKPGGLFIFDIWYTPAVLTLRPETRIKRMADSAVEITRIAESTMNVNQNSVEVQYEVQVRNSASGHTDIIRETHPMRHFTIPELELLALHTGFDVLQTEEFLSSNLPSTDTWGVCVVLRKR